MEIINTEQKLDKALDELFAREAHFEAKRTAAAIAEHTYRIKRAVEFKKAEGSVDLRKAISEIEADEEMRLRFIADAESDIAKEKLLDVRTAVSARQSILNAETRRPI